MRRSGLVVFLALFFAFGTVFAIAQQSPELESGLKPFGSFHGGDIDSVSLSSGNVVVHIPLISYPQRGGLLRLNYFLRINNKRWERKATNPPASPPVVRWAWRGGTGVTVVDDQIIEVGAKTTTIGEAPDTTTFTTYIAFTADGASHGLAGTKAAPIPGDPPLEYESVDATAIKFIPDPNGLGNDLIIHRDGVREILSSSGRRMQDPNGNFIEFGQTVVDTLGRTVAREFTPSLASCPSGATSATGTLYLGFQGTDVPMVFCYTNMTFQSSLGIAGIQEGASPTVAVLTALVLPNQTKWLFTYTTSGEIASITLPTGGIISYGWAIRANGSDTSRWVISRTVNDGTGPKTWEYIWGPLATSPVTHIVKDPPDASGVRNEHAHTFRQIGKGFYEILAQEFSGAQSGGVWLKTANTMYDVGPNGPGAEPMNVVVRKLTTIWPNGKVSEVQKDYDSGIFSPAFNANLTYGNVVEERVFDYGQNTPGVVDLNPPVIGPLLVKTGTQYRALEADGAAYKDANLVDLVTKVSVCGASDACDGNPANARSQTTYGYDGSAPIAVSPTPSTLNTSPPGPRGNQTSVSRWLNQPLPAHTVTTTSTYFNTGMVKSVQDPQLHTTNFSYDATFLGAYLTQATNALNQTTANDYDFNTGLLKSATDLNGMVTKFVTYDSVLRLTQKKLALGTANEAQIDYQYTDTIPAKVKVTVPVAGATVIQSEGEVDQLGRTRVTRLLTDPQGTTFTRTSYDNLGRALQTWNPSRCDLDANPSSCSGESTFGITTNVYDGLGRVTKIIPQDGNTNFNNVTTDFSSFPTVVVKDQQGKQRRSTSDALGRLVKVEEPAGSTPPTTGATNLTVSGNYQWTVTGGQAATSGSGSVGISGTERSYSITECDELPPFRCRTLGPYPDTGWVSITINGNVTKTAQYGGLSTASTVASDLASQFHNDAASPVDAQASGPTVSLWARTAGASTNYTLSVAAASTSGHFGSSSFTPTRSGPTLTGGQNAVPGSPICDSGSLWVIVAGFTASTTYNGAWNGSACTTTTSFTSVANALRDIFNNNLNSPVTASVTSNGSSATLALTSKLAGEVSNYSYQTGKSTNFPANFASASYGASPTSGSLSGGADGATLTTPAQTFYTYDAQGNLLKVEQQGTATSCNSTPPSGTCRVRDFEYDSLSRLTKATNPESGQITYSYDDDSNLTVKSSPAPNQAPVSATRISTNYSYDALHRLTGKTYTGITEPAVNYFYDESSRNGLTISNGKGRRTGMSDGSGQAAWSYDELGRVKAEKRVIGAVTNTISYSYNKDGSLASITYPSGRRIDYAYSPSGNLANSAGRAISAIDSTNAINYATDALYTPAGALAQLKNAKTGTSSGIAMVNIYNNRLQPVSLTATNPGGSAVLSLTYNFNWGNANNGNVLNILNNRDHNRDQSFSYDELNRVKTAATPTTWGLSFGYDPWGDLLSQNLTQGAAPILSAPVSNNRNQIDGFCYDPAGNLLKQAACPATFSSSTVDYWYDAENRVKTAGGVTYTYDGAGERVKKSSGKLYWSGMGSDPLVETDLAGANPTEFIFFNGKRTARRDADASVHYFFSDHLGSADVVTNASGAMPPEQESDYYPFGGERVLVAGPNNYKFTGKERDSETNLDYFGARYYASSLGRFITPDWAAAPTAVPYAHLGNPQTLNLYSYITNNPINGIDTDGHSTIDPTVIQENIQIISDAASQTASDAVIGSAKWAANAAIGAWNTFANVMNMQAAATEAPIAPIPTFNPIPSSTPGEETAQTGTDIVVTLATLKAAIPGEGSAPKPSSAAEENIPKYNRSEHYGNPSSSSAAKEIRQSAEGQGCPGCGEKMSRGTANASTAEHTPTLKQHYYTKGHQMTPQQRRAYARSHQSMSGALCKKCQSKEGAAVARTDYNRKK